MFDHDHRYIARLGDPRKNGACGARAVGVEVRCRLVEEQHARSEREDPGDGEALLLAARERRGRAVLAVREPDVPERPMDPRPDLSGWDAVVLETERDIVAGARHDELRLWVLEHESDAAPDDELALLVARARIEQARDRLKERALPRARRSQEKDALALVDPEIDSA
jgi:hypothetical protein